MTLRSDTVLKPGSRALLVAGVLLSLCASDNVGPRLLPLPVSAETAAASRQLDQGGTASRAPSRDKAFGARVEMASAQQSRAGAGRQLTHASAAASKPVLPSTLPAHLLRGEPYSPIRESSANFSRPRGRAPPRLA
ncbi:MAG TPA: hypothetical protein VK421_12115 [Pyrinomonadaceae bacterium]|nr:hypothetical protein [Pyrinomonadaceae bacterium]